MKVVGDEPRELDESMAGNILVEAVALFADAEVSDDDEELSDKGDGVHDHVDGENCARVLEFE